LNFLAVNYHAVSEKSGGKFAAPSKNAALETLEPFSCGYVRIGFEPVLQIR